MLDLYFTNKFKKDYKLMEKRGYNLNLIDDIIIKLSKNEKLSKENCDHLLQGKYKRIQRMSYSIRLAFNL